MPFRILVADDQPDAREALVGLLERRRHRVEVAACGGDALRLVLQGGPFDLSLLDVHMPDLSGLDVLEQLRARGRALPSILVTGHPGPEIEKRALALGALTLLRKPVLPGLLDLVLEELQSRLSEASARPAPPAPSPSFPHEPTLPDTDQN